MSPWLFVSLPLVGAAIGWCTNWLAVKMIFHPREQRRILGVPVQGVLPRRRSELAQKVADTVERDLISVEDIQKVVSGMVQGERVRKLLHERIDQLIAEQLQKLGSMVQMFVSDDLIASLKQKVESEVLRFIESMSGEIQAGIGQHLDVHQMVKERIEGFDMERLEQIVHKIAARELRHIEILGGFLGFTIGLIQAALIHWTT